MREKSKLAVKHRDIGPETRAATAFFDFWRWHLFGDLLQIFEKTLAA